MIAGYHERTLRHNAARYVLLAQGTDKPGNAAMWMNLARISMAKADVLEQARTGSSPVSQPELPLLEVASTSEEEGNAEAYAFEFQFADTFAQQGDLAIALGNSSPLR